MRNRNGNTSILESRQSCYVKFSVSLSFVSPMRNYQVWNYACKNAWAMVDCIFQLALLLSFAAARKLPFGECLVPILKKCDVGTRKICGKRFSRHENALVGNVVVHSDLPPFTNEILCCSRSANDGVSRVKRDCKRRKNRSGARKFQSRTSNNRIRDSIWALALACALILRSAQRSVLKSGTLLFAERGGPYLNKDQN